MLPIKEKEPQASVEIVTDWEELNFNCHIVEKGVGPRAVDREAGRCSGF